ncbi:MAG: hypothetical protein IKU37_09300 [Candidatus Gastranaerophilales bacterium]|nr:hypothetical protein [Candidatus Gastranaerophilales bacterium]
MSKNKFFKYFLLFFLVFFFNIHSVFALVGSGGSDFNNNLTHEGSVTIINAGQENGNTQKRIIGDSVRSGLGECYFGESETMVKARTTYEKEHAFQVTS